MSRRKQDKPQPRKRLGLVNSDADLLLADLLTCGVCQKEFVLSDIVKFIQHKIHLCNKENYKLQNSYDDGDCDSSDHSSPDAAADTKLQVSNKRPSISAPITRKGSLLAARLENRDHHHRSPPSPLPPPLSVSGASNDLRHGRHGRNHLEGGLDGSKSLIGDLLLSSASDRDHHRNFRRNASPHLPLNSTPSFFHSLHQRCRTPGRNNTVDVATNTTITEPTSYICSTCKSSFCSAWVLVQHAQNMHGLKIYLEPTLLPSSLSSAGPSGASARSTPSASSASSVGGLLPSGGAGGSSASALAGVAFLGSSTGAALDPSSSPLLRVPLGERQFGSSLNASALFSRPSSQDIGLLSDHYSRLNNHGGAAASSNPPTTLNNGGSLSITAAGGGGGGTTSATGPLTLNPFDSHHPFDRGPFEKIRVNPLQGLSFEPQLDFYSQRLRQLAGATSPNTALTTAATPSPRKLTPPFGSGGSGQAGQNTATASSHSSSEPSTPTPSQQTKDQTTAQARNSSCSSSEKDKDKGGPPLIVLRSSSPSSNGSKGGGGDVQPGSPKLKSCEFCGKHFRFQSNLIVHRRSHTGEKPFKCHICQHACTQASKLKRHMKTHRNKSPGDSTISENTSAGSARSTPDSTAGEGRSNLSHEDATAKDGQNENGSRKRRKERDLDDGNNSDSQAVDIEDDDDLDDEEEEEEMEGEDEDENSTDLIAEDLTTNKSVGESSNPADLRCNNKEPKTEPHENHTLASEVRQEARQSVLGEVMEKIGLSNIQQYNEAYRQALEESFAGNRGSGFGVKMERPASSELILPNSPHENGPTREDGNKSIGQSGLDFGMSLARAFESPLEKNKRLKLDHRGGGGDNSRDRDSLFAGMWLPSVAASAHRDLFYGVSSSDPDLFRLKSSSESALKSVTPGGSGRFSPRPGTSGSGVSSLLSAAAAAAAAASGHLSLTFPGGGSGSSFGGSNGGGGNGGQASSKQKTDRRNDTCEYCGKVFKNCSNLTVHRRSHTGEKPYKCELCSYACAQSSKLTRHMKTHGRVGKDVYRCRFCDMPFSVPSTLEKHMRKCVVNQNSSSGSALLDKDADYNKDDVLSLCGQPSSDGHESSRRGPGDSELLQYRGSSSLMGKDSSYKDDVLSVCDQSDEESRDDSRREADLKEVL